MHIVVTGANGFIGQHLVAKILSHLPTITGGSNLERLSLVDLTFDQTESLYSDNKKVKLYRASFADQAVIASITSEIPADLVFHLASVPSGAAQSNYALGMEVNVDGVYHLLETLRQQNNNPRLVFASSIAIYGRPESPLVNEDTQPTPNLTYGSQKVIGETLVADYTRRGWLQGCSLRLPGIVVRPPAPNGAVSIFFSDLIRSLCAGKSYTCPVSSQAKAWLMSVQCCVDNIFQAAMLQQETTRYTWTLPALHLSIDDLVTTINQLYPDTDASQLIHYKVDNWVEENFGSYPPLHCPHAENAGFKHDGTAAELIQRSVNTMHT